MKRVALYYPWIYSRGGVERMILEVLQRTCHRYTVFTNHLDYGRTFPEFRALDNVVALRRVSVHRSAGPVLAAALTILGQRLDLRGYDALLVFSEGLGDLITLRNRSVPVVCYCHSLARPAYDAVYRETLVARRPHLRGVLSLLVPPYRALTRVAWRHYRRVFVNSRTTREDVLANGLCPPDTVETLHPGVDLARVRPSDRYERFFLYAGRIKWTKNVELAVEAFRRFCAQRSDGSGWSLMVAGEVDAGSADYLRHLRDIAGGDAGVVFRPNLSREELEDLFGRCYALIFPSLNEPWGIVAIEGMAYRRPVLAVNRGGPTESVLDGETGYLLDPTPDAFAAAMERLAAAPALVQRLGRQAAAHVRQYSWDAFVRRLDEYLEDIP